MNTALKWLATVLATAILVSLTAWAAIAAIEADDAARAQHIAQKREAQRKRDAERQHATRLDRVANMVCQESHGPDAAHWFDESGVLVCAATRAAMDTAKDAVRIAQGVAR
jgi:hypothetical protein